MTTQTFASLYTLIEAYCGVTFAGVEIPRITAFVNSRAERAYRATEYWPRWLKVGEERAVTNGLIPYAQDSLDTIDTFLRVYRIAPYGQTSAQEFDYSVGFTGATLVIGSLDVESAFVTYKVSCPFGFGNGDQGEDGAIPQEWFQYLAHGVYSDFLRGEGQQEKAMAAEMEANDKLQDELLRISDSGMLNLIANKVSTVGNMQNRWSNSYIQSGIS